MGEGGAYGNKRWMNVQQDSCVFLLRRAPQYSPACPPSLPAHADDCYKGKTHNIVTGPCLTILIATGACSVVLLAEERMCEMAAQPCVPEARSGVPDRHTAIRQRR
jgi:hypothetical protein